MLKRVSLQQVGVALRATLFCAGIAKIVDVGTTPTSAALYGLTQKVVVMALGFGKGFLPGVVAGTFVAKMVDPEMDLLAAFKIEGFAVGILFHVVPFAISERETLENFLNKNFLAIDIKN